MEDTTNIILISAAGGVFGSMFIMMTWGRYFIRTQITKALAQQPSSKITDVIDETALQEALHNNDNPAETTEEKQDQSAIDTHSNLTQHIPQVRASFEEMNLPPIDTLNEENSSPPFSLSVSQMKPQILDPKEAPAHEEPYTFEALDSDEVAAISDPLPHTPEALPEPDGTEDEATVLMHRAPPK